MLVVVAVFVGFEFGYSGIAFVAEVTVKGAAKFARAFGLRVLEK